MSVLFSLLFFVALAGVIKPYIAGAKRWHFGLAALACLMIVGAFAPQKSEVSGAKKAASAAQGDGDAAGNAAQQPSAGDGDGGKAEEADGAQASAPDSPWHYSESKDEMRGTVSRFASVESENEVDLGFPYGTVHGHVLVRHRPQDGLNIMFQVDQGQILCNSLSDGMISVKFDKGPVQKFRCSEASDGSSETAFIDSASAFLRKLRGSSRLIVEAEFFQKGRQQFVFDIRGLQWK